MSVESLFVRDELSPGCLPCYDKSILYPAYIVGGDGESIICIKSSSKYFVPLLPNLDSEACITSLLWTVVAGDPVPYEGSLLSYNRRLSCEDLMMSTVLKHPDLTLPIPDYIKVVHSTRIRKDYFYCLADPMYVGIMPVQPAQNGVPELRGFTLANPRGVIAGSVKL